MALEINSIDNPGPAGGAGAEGETQPQSEAAASHQDTAGAVGTPAGNAVEIQPTAGTSSPIPTAQAAEALLAEISVTVREVADLSRRYHARAEQREGVIDQLRSELDTLRRGERRGLLRPVLADLCRLRGDLLSQAATLPPDFDAAKAADLLRSYAETIALTLESNGVVMYAPDGGERFDPRLHRRIGGEPTAEPALAGHVAGLRRDGYLDIEANSPIAPAEVTVFIVAKATEGER